MHIELFDAAIALAFLCAAAFAALWYVLIRFAEALSRLDQQQAVLDRIEDLAGIGHWHYNAITKNQVWSLELCRLHGLNRADCNPAGLPKDLQPESTSIPMQALDNHAETRGPFRFEYDIKLPDGAFRLLRMDAQNSFDDQGQLLHTDAVVMDVTQDYRRVEQLAQDKTDALQIAAKAEELALTDPLTGLANRRRIMAEIDRSIMHCRKHGGQLSLIIFDLDRFKAVNDTFGHQRGDDVLRRIARIACEQVRESDTLARVGGEEFVWLLPDTGPTIAGNVAERLRRAIETESSDGGLPQITASIGHCSWSMGDTSLALFAAADAALYVAKEGGRNQVCMAA